MRNPLVVVMLVCLAACDQSIEPAEIPVGVILPLSGTLGAPGQSVKNGMDLALEELNAEEAFRLRFVVEDTESILENATSAYTRLADDEGVPVIIGPAASSETGRVIPLINRKKVPALSPTSAQIGLSAQSEFLFRSSLTVDRVVPDGVRLSKKHLDYKNVATLVNEADAFSVSSNDFITQELGKYSDITIVHAATYSLSQGTELGDISAQLTAIRNAAPDVVFLSALPEGRIGVLTAAYRMGLRIPFIVNFISIEAVRAANAAEAGAAENAITFQVWLSSSTVAESRRFVSSYQSRFGEEPGDFAARGYAAVTILGEALKNISTYDAASIRNGLAEIKEFNSIYDSFSFDENGDAVTSPVIAEVRNNRFEVLSE